MASMAGASSVRSRARSEGSERSSYPGSGGSAAGTSAARVTLSPRAAVVAGSGFAAGAALAAEPGFAGEPGFVGEPGLAGEAGLPTGAGFVAAVALAAGAVFVVAVALAAGSGLVVTVALLAGAVFMAGAVIVVAADQLVDGPAGPRPAGCSGVQTCSAALVLTLSAVSRSCPIPAKTARSTTTGASLMRSLTCGIGMSHLSLACVPAIPLAGPAPARGEFILPWRPVYRSSGPMFVRMKTGVRRRGRGHRRGWRAALP